MFVSDKQSCAVAGAVCIVGIAMLFGGPIIVQFLGVVTLYIGTTLFTK